MPAKLSVNLNAIAMLRNRRDLPWPSVTGLGRAALAAGAHGLTVHPRPDERHTRHSDLPEIRALIDDEFPHAEFNIEGYPTEQFLELVERNQPEQVTLVPDDPSQATSDHGWNFVEAGEFLEPVVRRLKKGGFRVSLFSDPDPDVVAAAKKSGPTASNSTPAPTEAAIPMHEKPPSNWRSWAGRPMPRSRSDSRSMPATTSSSPTCLRSSGAFRGWPKCRSATD